jgi:uncharacterized protein (DUF1015 family)
MDPMSRFSPFPGLRYSPAHDLAEVTAPPYDVIDDAERAALAASHAHNAVHIDLPVEVDGVDRYSAARDLLARWVDDGVLVRDPEPRFYGYRMSFTDTAGRSRRSTGVLGALTLAAPGEGPILPHEHTTPKAKSDRLDLLRATATNLSPIWGLSPAQGLTAAIGDPPAEAPTWTDDDGVTHTLWVIDAPDRQQAISNAVDSRPVVVADGHHRYETSLQYRDERRAASPDGDAGDAEAAMVLVVELVADELTVLPIHRMLDGLAPDLELGSALGSWFDVGDEVTASDTLLDEMVDGGFLVLVEPGRLRAMRPRPGVFDHLVDLDTVRLDAALADVGTHEVSYQHGIDNVMRAVDDGRARAGVLVRPATIAQIAATADGGERMPPKTTFFHPKPKTGLVFRSTI